MLWRKLSALLAVIAGGLFAVLKVRSAKLDKAEHDLKIKDKADNIREKQDQAKSEALQEEEIRIEEQTKTPNHRSADDLNSL